MKEAISLSTRHAFIPPSKPFEPTLLYPITKKLPTGQLFDEMLQPTGLRSTQFTLLVAVALLGEAPVTQLSRALVMDRTTLARNLKPLESLGLLTVEAGTDRRRHLVRLTERGRQALARALPYWERAQHQMVTRLGQEQWHALRASLKATMTLAQSV